jgi:hypothetical protein
MLVKKLGIGCLVVLVLFLVLGAVAAYFVYDRLVQPAAEYAASFKELGALSELERRVKNTSAFTAPDSGELSEEAVERFIGVQDAMRKRLGKRLDGLKAKYDQIERQRGGGEASFREAMGALKDLTSTLVEAKRAQVDALNAAGFSVEEYEWVRNQAYAGLGVVAGAFDVKDLARAAREGGESLGAAVGEVSEHNRELIKRHEAKLRELAPLAFFGL